VMGLLASSVASTVYDVSRQIGSAEPPQRLL
jgi:hypothetical protein